MSTSDTPTPEEVDAIRAVIQGGGVADFHDVADVVRKKFGFHVGAGMVEEVYHAMHEEEEADGDVPPAPAAHSETRGEEVLEKVLRFAQDMGGFDNARAALDAVEKRLKELM